MQDSVRADRPHRGVSLTKATYYEWVAMSVGLFGTLLPITKIEPGMLTHEIADGEEPLVTLDDGETTRRVTMKYDTEGLRDEFLLD